jgi:hypothetical protein
MEFKLPEGLRLGTYSINVEDDEAQVGSGEFTVLRYDLPNFIVNVSPDKRFYLPEDMFAEIKINAEYLFGEPVADGVVRVVDADGTIDPAEIVSSVLENSVRARIDLSDAHEELRVNRSEVYLDKTFVAFFTDPSTNRTESRRFDLRITREPIHVYFIRFDTDLSERVPFKFYVSTYYADGTPVSCDIAFEGHYETRSVRRSSQRAERTVTESLNLR